MALIIPIFITHEGCPHHCYFCNQQSIVGEKKQKAVSPEMVNENISSWLARSPGRGHVQVAFYGGSFSCLAAARQLRLMAVVAPFLSSKKVNSIRISTRPDCLDETRCENLYRHGVRTVELGCQSMDDTVLEATRRGHSVEQSIIAAELLQKKNMELGIQLMVGLPGETCRSFLAGVERVIRLQPDFVRLYPALVLEKTRMASMYQEKSYRPLSLNQAVALTCQAFVRLQKAGIKVIRMGLQPSKSLEKSIVAGPYHPAFGELVMARTWFKRTRKVLSECPDGKTVNISISDRDLSAFLGPKRANMDRLEQLGLVARLNLETRANLCRGTLHHDLG